MPKLPGQILETELTLRHYLHDNINRAVTGWARYNRYVLLSEYEIALANKKPNLPA